MKKEKKLLPVKENHPFDSNRFSAESLQNQLWDVLTLVRSKGISPSEANAVTMAAKEICNIARLKLQYSILSGDFDHTKQIENE